jgi:hypothetical protein
MMENVLAGVPFVDRVKLCRFERQSLMNTLRHAFQNTSLTAICPILGSAALVT